MFLSWLTRLFRRETAKVLPKDIPRAPGREPAGIHTHTHEAPEFDLRTVAEYPLARRCPLSQELQAEQQRLVPVLMYELRQNPERVTPIPVLAQHLFSTLESSDAPNINTLVSALHQDPAVAASILRAANSAAFLGRGRVQGVREAVMRIGPAAARQIAISAALDGMVEAQARALPPSLSGLCRRQWSHALTVAQSAGWLTSMAPGDIERAYLSGLLHDLGKLVALHALVYIPGGVALPEELIDSLLEEIHVEVGISVAARWRLPAYATRVMSDHHERPAVDDEPETHLVRLCSGLDEIRLNPRHRMGLSGKVLDTAEQLGLKAPVLRALVTQLREADARNLAARRATTPPPRRLSSGVPFAPLQRAIERRGGSREQRRPSESRDPRPLAAQDEQQAERALEQVSSVGSGYEPASRQSRPGSVVLSHALPER